MCVCVCVCVLYILQKRAVRYIHKASYNSHTGPLYKNYSVLKLSYQHEYEVLLSTHAFVSGDLPRSIDNVCKYNCDMQADHQTMQSNKIQIDH